MKAEAYLQYRSEASNWLKAARLKLLSTLLEQYGGTGHDLRILEIGAGVGQNVDELRKFGTVDVLEIDPLGLAALRELDGVNQVFDQPIPVELGRTYDAIIAFDVLEHLEDDRLATKWIAGHLNAGGHLIATVPAYQWMFSDHDVALEHYRRYTKNRLVEAMPPDMTARRAGYFVCLLFPLAAVTRTLGKLTKRLRGRSGSGETARKQSSSVPSVLDNILEQELTAEVKVISRGRGLPFGLSVFCVVEKNRS